MMWLLTYASSPDFDDTGVVARSCSIQRILL